jgi:hypothetical protein
MKILYIAWSKQQPSEIYADPSVWYRCFQPAQALRGLGHIANVIPAPAVTIDHIKAHECVIFFRPLYSNVLVELVNLCEMLGTRYLASYDDLFFDIGFLRHSGFRKLAAPQEQILADRPELYAKAFYFFEEFVSSTDGLKNAILKQKPEAKVYLHYNGIPPEVENWAQVLRSKKSNVHKIGYFAGGAIHTPDLLKITPALHQVLKEQKAIFYCVETVQVPKILLDTGQVETTPRMNYTGMLHAYSSCDVTIAPLELNDFTNSKSGIKFLESASFGNSVIATPIDDIVRVGNELLYPALSETDWYNQITSAITANLHQAERDISAQNLTASHSTHVEAQKFLTDITQNHGYAL